MMANEYIYGKGLVPLSAEETQKLRTPAPPEESVQEKIARLEAEIEILKGELGI